MHHTHFWFQKQTPSRANIICDLFAMARTPRMSDNKYNPAWQLLSHTRHGQPSFIVIYTENLRIVGLAQWHTYIHTCSHKHNHTHSLTHSVSHLIHHGTYSHLSCEGGQRNWAPLEKKTQWQPRDPQTDIKLYSKLPLFAEWRDC